MVKNAKLAAIGDLENFSPRIEHIAVCFFWLCKKKKSLFLFVQKGAISKMKCVILWFSVFLFHSHPTLHPFGVGLRWVMLRITFLWHMAKRQKGNSDHQSKLCNSWCRYLQLLCFSSCQVTDVSEITFQESHEWKNTRVFASRLASSPDVVPKGSFFKLLFNDSINLKLCRYGRMIEMCHYKWTQEGPVSMLKKTSTKLQNNDKIQSDKDNAKVLISIILCTECWYTGAM